MDSIQKFTHWLATTKEGIDCSVYLSHVEYQNAAYAAWKAGRESMREEAVEKCVVSTSYRAVEMITKEIKAIKP